MTEIEALRGAGHDSIEFPPGRESGSVVMLILPEGDAITGDQKKRRESARRSSGFGDYLFAAEESIAFSSPEPGAIRNSETPPKRRCATPAYLVEYEAGAE